MKYIKKFLLTIVFVLLFLIVLAVKSNASNDLLLNNLDFDVKINTNGSMDITEIWNIEINDTNTLFKTFKSDSSKYSDITNVQVSEITNGANGQFKEINESMYHVTKNCYYGEINDDGNFEIAWGVGLDNDSANKQYKVSYTVEDAIAKYNDYAQLYWQFIGSEFEIPAKKVTGTITLPSNAKIKDDIKVWGHTEDLNGEIYVTNLNEIKFELDGFNLGRYIEIRSLFPTEMIISSNRTYNKEILNSVIEEETIWANEANNRRVQRDRINLLITGCIVIISLLLMIYSTRKLVKSVQKLKESKEYTPNQKLKYYKDLPRKNSTPAQALYTYKEIKDGLSSSDIGKVVSATFLNLSLKKHIKFNINKEKNKDIISISIINPELSDLSSDEIVVFNLLIEACKNKDNITVKDFEKYIKNSLSKRILGFKNSLDLKTKKELVNNEIFDINEEKKYKDFSAQNTLYFIIIFFAILALLSMTEVLNIIGYISIIALIICQIISITINCILLKRINVFTQKGIDEKEMWKGLKNYMEDFSMLDKKELPELIIWEHFLVFATVFGISDKVLKQLKIVYPDIEANLDMKTYSCMYFMTHTNFTSSFTNAINTSISSTYSSASGGGGGFSGGGGGGRWPEEVEEVDNSSFFFN